MTTRSKNAPRQFLWAIEAILLVGLVACDDAGRTTDGVGVAGHWISEAEYEIGDDTTFSWVPYLRVSREGHRIFVAEPNSGTVTVWAPEGSLVFAVGRRGEGPGELVSPYRLHVQEDGSFYVRDWQRFTYFASTGQLIRTVAGPPRLVSYQGFRVQVDALLRDGSYLGRAEIGAAVRQGWQGDPPLVQEPLLRVRESEGEWLHPETIFLLNIRNDLLAFEVSGADSYGAQPFSDADMFGFDPGAEGAVVVVRRAGMGPGVVELLELAANGDTIWQRKLEFEPMKLTEAMVDGEVRPLAEAFSEIGVQTPYLATRRALEEAFYEPEYAPPVRTFQLAASGELWLGTWEMRDTLRVWYSVRRGDEINPPRPVLLPEWFSVLDATETHVWGVRTDELDVPYVVGRRLVQN